MTNKVVVSWGGFRELESSVRSAIRHWQKRNGLKLRSYYFGGARNEKWLDFPMGV